MTLTVQEKMRELLEMEDRILQMGGEKAVAKQKEKGKLTARERMERFFDQGTFQETDMFVKHRCTNFGMEEVDVPAEGVITGYGKVDGRWVCAYSQDFTSRAGSLGEMHSKKICKIMDLALKSGVPMVGLNDSGGARIQEGVDALSGYGQIFFRNSNASGVIPQISAIMGPTAGGAVYSPAMTDFVFMVKKSSYMFITGPEVIKSVTGEEVTFEDLGGAMVHNQKSGVAHFACESDEDALDRIRELLSFLPRNNMEDPPVEAPSDDPLREDPELDEIVPDSANQAYDMKRVIASLADNGETFEPHAHYATNMLTCFIRLNGYPVGVIANQPSVYAGCLDIDASDKATRFIRFCDAFNIPLLTLADVPGYLPGTQQEWGGIIRHGAKLLWCYSEATVPKMLLVTRKSYGGSYLAMCSKDLGADMVFAWPSAEIAVMGASGAANVIHRKEIKEAEDPEAKRQEKIKEYEEIFSNPYRAANRGYIDAVIQPRESRRRLIAALDILMSKREARSPKKHGNIPM
ncbi:MAG: methylmalonyl-CoA carboxyltransferase [Desulfohalobiaceae bacterium]|nr:methylmalonyl-CoA carboxyltransferase [Desulfohalobiaceae bacterium]